MSQIEPIEEPRPAEEQQPVKRVVCQGSFVYKAEIRRILNIKSSDFWLHEVQMLRETVEGFTDDYEPYRTKHRVPIALAKTIINTIFDRSGEEKEVQYVWEGDCI